MVIIKLGRIRDNGVVNTFNPIHDFSPSPSLTRPLSLSRCSLSPSRSPSSGALLRGSQNSLFCVSPMAVSPSSTVALIPPPSAHLLPPPPLVDHRHPTSPKSLLNNAPPPAPFLHFRPLRLQADLCGYFLL